MPLILPRDRSWLGSVPSTLLPPTTGARLFGGSSLIAIASVHRAAAASLIGGSTMLAGAELNVPAVLDDPVLSLHPASDRGEEDDDGISNDLEPRVLIDADPDVEVGDSVNFFVDGVEQTASALVLTQDDIDGLTEIRFPALSPSIYPYSLQVSMTNGMGESGLSNAVPYTANTSLGAATLALATGGLTTDDTTPTMRVGNADAVAGDVAYINRKSDGFPLVTKVWDATDVTNEYADMTLPETAEGAHELDAGVYGTAAGSGAGSFSENAQETLTVALAYQAQPAVFDGSSYLNYGDVSASLSDTKLATISCWLNLPATAAWDGIFCIGNTRFALRYSIDGTRSIWLDGTNAAGTFICRIKLTNGNFPTATPFHCAISLDMASGWSWYIDGADASAGVTVTTFTDDTIDMTATKVQVGKNDLFADGGQIFTGEIADLRVDIGVRLDLTDSATRAKLIDGSGNPVDQGTDGTGSGLRQPEFYHTGLVAAFKTNGGTISDAGLTETGTLTQGTAFP